MTIRCFIAIISISLIIICPSISISSELLDRLTGATKVVRVYIRVLDSDTKQPIWGAHVMLEYDKQMKDSVRERYDDNRECNGQVEGVTDKDGKSNLFLKVKDCPTRGIESEELTLTVRERNYANYQQEVKAEQIDVALERVGYNKYFHPLNIEYPQYFVDIDKYKSNFDLLNVMNKRNIGDKFPVKSYFAKAYSHDESVMEEGFYDFLEKVGFISNITGISLLQEILDRKYPLPYKRMKFKKEESWRSDDYVYDIGRDAVGKSLVNIADDRADRLLPLTTNIPEAYFKLLTGCGVQISTDDYWDYLSGRYVSKAHNFMIGQPPRPDPLIFFRSKLKENVSSVHYADCLFKAYQVTSKNGEDKIANEHYKWQVDNYRIADELFGLDSHLFKAEVKRLLPTMEPNRMTRKYIAYLYRQGEYDYLADSLRNTKNLLNAFLAEDVKESHSVNTITNERKELGIEECLITKLPKVTERIKTEIAAHLKGASVNFSFYRWWIRNLAYVNMRAANSVARDIYTKSQSEPYEYDYKYAKQYVLRGAAEAKLTGLCKDVYADLQPKDILKRDYFSVAEERIHYLFSSCPNEFKKYVFEFNVAYVKAQAKKKSFELASGGDDDHKDYRESIWSGVEKYFPKEQAVKILGEHVCDNNKLIQGIYFGSNVFPERYTVKCLCERLEKNLPTLNKAAVCRLTKYLDRCYPERKQEHYRMQMSDWERDITDRSYQGLINIVKGVESPTPIFDDKLKAFFTGTTSTEKKFRNDIIDWSSGIEADKSFPLLHRALNSQDTAMVQAALYACSFYASKFPPAIKSDLKKYLSQSVYPNYLYAAYSLAVNNPADIDDCSACEKSMAYHLNIIENRSLGRYDENFAFNVLLNLDMCSRTRHEKEYLKLLDAIMKKDSMGRYESFQKDLEAIILNSSIKINNLIEKLTISGDTIDIILGLHLAQLKKYQLDPELLGKMLKNDDSYVRLAAANYIKANSSQYQTLYIGLKDNTNKKVRKLISD